MMTLQTMQDAFLAQLGDIYDAEHRFLKGQQEMLGHAASPQLQNMLQQHCIQTQGQIKTLDQVFSTLGTAPKGETCDTAQGLVAEVQEDMREAGTDTVRDVLIAAAAGRMEHYEIAAYRSLIAMAQAMGQQEAVSLLQQNLRQEEHTAQLIEISTPQLLDAVLQTQGMRGSGKDMPSMEWHSDRAASEEQAGVKTAGAADLLIDDTATTSRMDTQGHIPG